MARIELHVNGRDHLVAADPDDRLLGVLREDLGLTGAKYGCGEGQCGACTVLVDGQAVRSCVTRIGSLAGRSITTIEGLSDGGRLHPVQQEFIRAEAFQCGYCTPGMVMGAVALLQSRPPVSKEQIARLMNGHVCRCGTYARILEAVHQAAARIQHAGPRPAQDARAAAGGEP